MSEQYKGYEIVSNQFSNKLIKAIGKGSVHKELRGLYTSLGMAKQAIDSIKENSSEPTEEVVKNVTTKNTRRAN